MDTTDIAKNYFLSTSPSVNFSVKPAVLTIAAAPASKDYGSNDVRFSWSSSGLYSRDQIASVVLHSVGERDTASVGKYAIDSTQVTGVGLKNYTINFQKGELTVQPRKLTIKASELSKTYGDILVPKKSDFSIVNGELFPGDRIDSVAISCNGFGQAAKVGTADTIINIKEIHGIRLKNYNISTKAGILTIYKKDLTITPLGQKKVYGDVFRFTGSEYDKKQAQLVNNDLIEHVGMTSLATREKTTVGEYTISTCVDSVKGVGLDNYKIIIDTLKNKFTIDPKAITIRVDTLTKIYGEQKSITGQEFKVEGTLVGDDKIDRLDLISFGIKTDDPVNEEGYDIIVKSVTCSKIQNYTINKINGKLKVVRKKLTPGLSLPANLNYNAEKKTVTATDIPNLKEIADYGIRYISLPDTTKWNSYTAPSAAGKYKAVFALTSLAANNYFMDSIPWKEFTVVEAPLTIKAIRTFKTYGDSLKSDVDLKSEIIGKYYDPITRVVLSCEGLKDTASVKSYEIKLDSVKGSGLSNYNISFVKDSLIVLPKNLEIQAIGKTKTYGDSISVTGKEFYIKPGSMVGNDYANTVSISCKGFITTAKAGIDTIRISNAEGKGLSNYIISYKNAILAINPKELTITPRKQTKVYGDVFRFAGKEYTISQGNLIGNDLIKTAEMTSPATEVNTSAGTHKISIGKIDGTGLDNYTIKTADSTFTVTPKPITIWVDTLTKKYGELLVLDGKKFRASSTASCDKIEELRLESDGIYADAAVNEKGYGIKATEIYGILKQNYNITIVDGLLKVIRQKLTAWLVAPSLNYDAKGKKFSATVDIPGLKEGTDYEIRYLNLADTTQSYSNIAPTAAGNYKAVFVLTSLAANKYYMESVPSMEFSIKKAPLTIKAKDASKTYGSRLNPADIGFVLTNGTTLFGNDIVTKLDFESKGMADTASIGKLSVIPVKAYGYGIENYDIAFESGILSVNPKELVVKALDDTKTYGDNITPVGNKFYVNPNDLIGNDYVTSVTLESEGYAQLALVGNYQLRASDAKGNRLKNYTISYEGGYLRVNKKKITVSAKALAKVYGSEYVFRGDEFVIPQNELVGNDRINAVKLGSQGATKKASVGEYPLTITDISGYRTENYDISTEGNLFKVTPMPIVVTAKNLEKEFGDVLSFNGNEFSTDLEPVNGDTISFVFMRSNGSIEAAQIGEYDIVPSQAFGAGSLNYSISYRNGKLKVIQKELKVAAQNCEKEYGEKDPELRFSAVDRRGIEYQSSIFTGKMARQAGEKVGTYTINRGSLSIASSYKFNFTEGQLTIQKALPIIDPSFTNEGGQFVAADIIGAKNGSTPQGNLKVKITQAGIEKTTGVLNGESKCAVSGLPTQMTVAELEYLGDENYLSTTQTLNIYAIVYHTNGGNMVSPVTNFDGSETIKLEAPTREQNYRFEGWYETEDFSGEPVRRIPMGTTHDIHLYAKWSTTYEDISLVVLFNQVLAVANPLNRDFLYKSNYKWYKDGVLLDYNKQYCGFENYVPTGVYKVEIYYLNNAPIVLELNHTAIIPKSKVYPNPVSKASELKLLTELIKEDGVTVEVFNTAGVREPEVRVKRYEDIFKLNGFKENGTYIIRVISNGKVRETHKVIVEN